MTAVVKNEAFEVHHELDTCGLFCPEPVMMLHNKIRDMKSGEVVRVIATDPSTQRDIPKFCNFLDHPLLDQNEQDNQYVFWIRKREH
ncbi:sulfurtransferase TusA [Endozoicomonas ascidiicola]|uniref:sulfurtransferase TusA n=1 Tax=Endozoicomonas ascidiicola TaxID=1698521 RepID=UPI00082DBCE4|nr:sulfurtransferase TusA [Endozoicomonas ascidiicola]